MQSPKFNPNEALCILYELPLTSLTNSYSNKIRLYTGEIKKDVRFSDLIPKLILAVIPL
jgi:hypothetical protein